MLLEVGLPELDQTGVWDVAVWVVYADVGVGIVLQGQGIKGSLESDVQDFDLGIFLGGIGDQDDQIGGENLQGLEMLECLQ